MGLSRPRLGSAVPSRARHGLGAPSRARRGLAAGQGGPQQSRGGMRWLGLRIRNAFDGLFILQKQNFNIEHILNTHISLKQPKPDLNVWFPKNHDTYLFSDVFH